MGLGELPVELLAQILDGDRSNAAIALWQSGSRQLATKLKNNGILDLRLKCEVLRYSALWPQCLQEFKLRSLVIECGKGQALSVNQLRSGLSLLNRSLIRLEVHHTHVFEAIFGDTLIPGVFDLHEGFLIYKHAKVGDEVLPKVHSDKRCDLSETLDKLEVLKLFGAFDGSPRLTGRATALLPPSLTTLDIGPLQLHYSANYGVQLPNLRTLIMDSLKGVEHLPLLPRTLTNVGVTYWHIYEFQELAKEHGAILPNLVELLRSPTYYRHEAYQHNGSWLPFITSLKIFSAEGLSSFPQSLTELSFEGIFPECNPFIGSASIFPDTLTRLTMQGIPWSSVTTKSWPRSLSFLVFDTDAIFGPMHYHRLPRTLTRLGSCGVGEDPPSPEFNFDAATALGRQMLEDCEKQSWSAHKQELILAGKRNGGRFQSKMEAYIAAIERGELYGLPLGLLTVYFCSLHLTPGSRLLLPPCLRTLVMKTFDTIDNVDDFWSLLPLSLDSLSLFNTSPNPSKLLNTTNLASPSDFGLYHHNTLYDLTFDMSLADFLPASMAYLPRSLRELTTPLSFDSLRDLPPTLTKLSAHFTGEATPTNWLSTLPRTLKQLYISNVDLTGPELLQLPPNLELLSCSFSGISLDHLLDMACNSLRTLHGAVDRDRSKGAGLLTTSEVAALCDRFRPFWRIFHADRTYLDIILATLP